MEAFASLITSLFSVCGMWVFWGVELRAEVSIPESKSPIDEIFPKSTTSRKGDRKSLFQQRTSLSPNPAKKKKNHSLILNRKKNEPWLRDWKLCLKGCNQGKRASMNLQLHKCQINITRGQKSVLSKLSSIWNLSLFYKQNPS